MIVATATEKGGVGKTTLSTNFAAMRAGRGHTVRIYDSDKSENAYAWAQLRREKGVKPELSAVKVRGNFAADVLADRDTFDTIIIDTPGDLDTELRVAVAVADVLVIPLRIGQFDTWSLGHMAKLVYDVRLTGKKLRVLAVINAVPFNIKQELRDSQAMLAEMSDYFEAAPYIVDRPPYRSGSRGGLAVTELPPEMSDDKAVAEITSLYEEVFRV